MSLWDNLLSSSANGIYMSTGHVEYASLNGTHIFKLIGEVRDLTQTTFIDSTVLGVLAKLGLKLKQVHQIQAVMLSTNSDITTLANSMGLGQVFVILNYCGDPNVCTRTLMEEHVTHNNMLCTVLDAHKTLMKLNESNQNMFEPLVKQLQKEQDSIDQTAVQHNA